MTADSRIAPKGESGKILQTLEQYQDIISETKIYLETVDSLSTLVPHHATTPKIRHIRCLALGSPQDSKPALYQLAYLLQIQHHFGIISENVSLFDPVFSDSDVDLLTKHFQFKIEESYTVNEDIDSILFFLPHAGLEITEQLISVHHPRWVLGNYLISHTDRLSKQKLFDNHKNLAHLVKLMEDQTKISSETSPNSNEDDGFTSVSHGKSRNGKRKKNKYVYNEPQLEYDFTNTYYESIACNKISSQEGAWGNAFTDLACHYIIPRGSLDNKIEVTGVSDKSDKDKMPKQQEETDDVSQQLKGLTLKDA